MSASYPNKGYSRTTWTLLLCAMTFALVVVGFWYYQIEAVHIRQQQYQALSAIARLKVGQIIQWRKERLGDLERSSKSPLFARALARFLENPGDAGLRKDLQERMRLELRKDVYSDVLLLDVAGDTLIDCRVDSDPVAPATKQAVREAIRLGRAVISEFYVCPKGRTHLDFAAPVKNESGEAIGIEVFRCDARTFLYPMIQSWPTTSPSAETLIVKRSGGSALFSSPLRHRAADAPTLRIPLQRRECPAVQAVLGRVGVFEGVDYRGERVMAYLTAIPDSGWFMVAKVDSDEILAEVYYRAYAIAIVVIVLIALSISIVAFAHRQQMADFYKKMYRSEHEKLEAREIFRTTLYSIGDAVITTDIDGFIRQMNPAAGELTGWKEADALSRPITEVFRLINEDSRVALDSPVARVLLEDRIVSVTGHTLLVSRDGTERPVANSWAPIRDGGKQICGVVLVFRDQTQEREAQHMLLESELQYRTLADSGQALIWTANRNGKRNFFNRTWMTFTGRTLEREMGDGWMEGVHHDDLDRCLGAYAGAAGRQGRFEVDYRLRRHDGVYRWIQEQSSPRFDSQGTFLGYIGHCLDITERKRTEEALRESEERFRKMFRRHNAIMLLIDPYTGKILDANRAAADFYGYAMEELLRMNIQQINTLSAGEIAGQRTLALNENCNYFIFPHRLSNGETRTVEVHSSPITTKDGTTILFSIIHDISERMRAQSQLAEKTGTLECVFESAPYIMMLVDSEGRVSYINRQGEEFTGKEKNGITGLLAGEALECVNSLTGPGCGRLKVCESCPIHKSLSHTRRTGESIREMEGVVEIVRDGQTLPVDILISTSVVQTGDDRKILVTIADITLRKRAENERSRLETARRQLEMRIIKSTRDLAESERKFRIIAENTEDLFYLMDISDLRYSYISPACEAIFGVSRNAFYESPHLFHEMVHPDDAELVGPSAYGKALEGPLVMEYRIIRPDGETRWILDKLSPVADETGRSAMLAGVCRDVTEHRFMQNQLLQNERLASLGTLSASVAHEINNPNSFIFFNLPILKGYVERLLSVSDNLPPAELGAQTWCGMAYDEFRRDALSIIGNIEHGSLRIHAIVANLKDFSRYKDRVEKVRAEIGELIHGAVKMCKPRCRNMVKNMFIEVPENLPMVFTDPQLLQQVLMNLIVNAAQAANKEDSWIRISAEPSRTEPGHLAIEIADNGCGMDQKTLKRIFDPFFTTKSAKEGTGLGLSICRNLVESLGGGIAVESEKGEGTVFRVLLPTAQFEAAANIVL